MAEVTIEQFYPMHIGYALNPFHDDIKKDLTKYCFDLQSDIEKGGNNWISNQTYNTCDTYNIVRDEKFKQLNNWITEKVNEFSNNLNIKDKLKLLTGWFNIYNKNDFQELGTYLSGRHS